MDFPHLSKWPRPSRFQYITLYHTKVTGKLQLAGTSQFLKGNGRKFLGKLWKTNMSSENQWLEVFPIEIVPFLGTC